jgi:Protein of unknown function (DUF2911)
MKKVLLLSSFLCAGAWSFAQIRTPQPSPGATVMQTVGVTDITVKYSRPGMKGREVFGKLIPFDKVWRTGANQATTIETSTDMTVEGQKLAAGKYAIMSIPNTSEWTVIFSKNLTVSEQNYKEADDVLRVKVAPSAMAMPMQSFGFGFNDLTDSTATMYFAWETSRVNLKLGVATTAAVESAIDKAAEQSANNMNAGANYLLSKGMNMQKALGMINQATSYKETFRNVWTKAQILSKLGNFAEAAPLAQKALELGQASNDPSFGFVKDAITKGLDEYKSKIPAIIPAILPKKKK